MNDVQAKALAYERAIKTIKDGYDDQWGDMEKVTYYNGLNMALEIFKAVFWLELGMAKEAERKPAAKCKEKI